MLLLCVLVHVWLNLAGLGRAEVISYDLSSAEDRARAFVSKAWTASQPVKVDGEAVKVFIDISDVILKFEETTSRRQQTCGITAWVRQRWHDYRLDWSNRPDMNSVSGVQLTATSNWTPSIDVVGWSGLPRTLPRNPTEALVNQTGTVMTVAPVELKVPVRRSRTGGRYTYSCMFTITSMLTDMTFIDLVSRNSTFDVGHFGDGPHPKEMSIQRRLINRDCSPKPFAALDYTIII